MRLDLLKSLNAEREARRAAVLVTDFGDGSQRLIREADFASDALSKTLATQVPTGKSGVAETDTGRVFLELHLPPPRLVITGAVHISQALAPMARVLGYDATIIDPRTAFATAERFPGVPLLAEWPETALPKLALDRWTAFVALTHDPKIDDPALDAALASNCFYVGALGSKRTHGRRVESLKKRGVSEEAVARIHAPIGLNIGASSPAEIALAILAEITMRLRRGPEAKP